jgi:uncharacterized protein YeaO (DUF488 family)
MPRIRVVRVYAEPRGGGYRVLVDRLWPRGVAKESLDLDEWAKDVAPSSELRRWYSHEPERFEEFARRYRDELRRGPAVDVAARLAATARRRALVLLTATRDVERSGAVVLAHHLTGVQP